MVFCNVDIADYNPRSCGIDFAGIVGIGIISDYENPENSNLEDPGYWLARITETPLQYFVIRNTRGSYQEQEVIEEEDLVGTLVTGVNHQAIIDVPKVQENRDFWEAIKLKNWKLCLINSGGLMFYIDKPVTFIPKIVNPKSVKQCAYFQVVMKWTDISNPHILDAPEGIFSGNISSEVDGGLFDYTFEQTFE